MSAGGVFKVGLMIGVHIGKTLTGPDIHRFFSVLRSGAEVDTTLIDTHVHPAVHRAGGRKEGEGPHS